MKKPNTAEWKLEKNKRRLYLKNIQERLKNINYNNFPFFICFIETAYITYNKFLRSRIHWRSANMYAIYLLYIIFTMYKQSGDTRFTLDRLLHTVSINYPVYGYFGRVLKSLYKKGMIDQNEKKREIYSTARWKITLKGIEFCKMFEREFEINYNKYVLSIEDLIKKTEENRLKK